MAQTKKQRSEAAKKAAATRKKKAEEEAAKADASGTDGGAGADPSLPPPTPVGSEDGELITVTDSTKPEGRNAQQIRVQK